MKSTENVLEKSTGVIPLPSKRPPGWLKYEDAVIFVILDDKGVPRLRTGHSCSWPGSHGAGFEIDNISKTIVWCNQVLNDLSDNADDAHEKSFSIKNPCLLKLDEIKPLRDARKATEWFKGVYPRNIAHKIAKLLSRPYFGLHDEAKEKAAVAKKFSRRSDLNLRWWQKHGRPHPVFGKVGRLATAT